MQRRSATWVVRRAVAWLAVLGLAFGSAARAGPPPAGEIIRNTANASYAAVPGPTSSSSNTVTFAVRQATVPTSTPDLVVSLTPAASVSVGHIASYDIGVRNLGTLASSGAVVVTNTLPAGFEYVAAGSGGAGWSCTAAAQAVTCTSRASVPASANGSPGMHPNVLRIRARAQASAFPSVPVSVANAVVVSGGSEPAANAGNNDTSGSTIVQAAASVSGLVWRDFNHNRLHDDGAAAPAAGWIAELCPPGVAQCDAGNRIGTANTASDGTYRIDGLAPAAYRLQFRDPSSRAVNGRPVNGDGVHPPQQGSQPDASTGQFLDITLAPGENKLGQSLPVDPTGVVYDTVTRRPVPGAVVTLQGPPGFDANVHLVGGAGNVAQTVGVDGAYQFLLTAVGVAQLADRPFTIAVTVPAGYEPAPSQLLPAAKTFPDNGCAGAANCIDPTGLAAHAYSVQSDNIATAPPQGADTRYFLRFALAPGDPDIVNNHLPIDPIGANLGNLLVQKVASQQIVSIGEFVEYTVTVKNTSPNAVRAVALEDVLPTGFTYVRGSARIDGKSAADPAGAGGPRLGFPLGELAADTSAAVTYRVLVGGAAPLGNGVNSASARARGFGSNTAQVRVRVIGGVFDTRGFILGTVFLDCNGNGEKDGDDIGIPGVRVFIEDGSLAITDAEGKYSLYGVTPRTHVLKVDPYTMPAGATLAVIDNRQAMYAGTRFIDMKNGELQRGDFAARSCTREVLDTVKARRAVGGAFAPEADGLLKNRLPTEAVPPTPTDVRGLPSGGMVGAQQATGGAPVETYRPLFSSTSLGNANSSMASMPGLWSAVPTPLSATSANAAPTNAVSTGATAAKAATTPTSSAAATAPPPAMSSEMPATAGTPRGGAPGTVASPAGTPSLAGATGIAASSAGTPSLAGATGIAASPAGAPVSATPSAAATSSSTTPLAHTPSATTSSRTLTGPVTSGGVPSPTTTTPVAAPTATATTGTAALAIASPGAPTTSPTPSAGATSANVKVGATTPAVMPSPVAPPEATPGAATSAPPMPLADIPIATTSSIAATGAAALSSIVPLGAAPPAATTLEAHLTAATDNKLAFVNLKDRAVLPTAQTNVMVKGPLGASFVLTVNGGAVPDSRVGKKGVLEAKQIAGWEYVGVDLKPGENTLAVQVIDPFGNARASEKITAIAPDQLARMRIDAPETASADGGSRYPIGIVLTDAQGVPVTSRTPLTLETSAGRFAVEDLNPNEPGVQVFLEGGRGEFELIAPAVPGDAFVRATSGAIMGETQVVFLPELRPLVGAGVIEGAINLRNLDLRNVIPARQHDGFDQELQNVLAGDAKGASSATGRAALFLKGKIRGDYLLTLAYDSDKAVRELLFRDIQPDAFYPIYGDASIKGFDAQSTSRLFVRIDKGRSYVLYGDFTTQSAPGVRVLSQYPRALTGAKAHYEDARVAANVFGSNDTFGRMVEEFPANGTSGPFQLNTRGSFIAAERVEVLTRDRNQPSIVLKVDQKSRFTDYEIEPLTGRLLFKAPVPSLDLDLNPITIRITYEVDQGGTPFWVYGGDAQVRITDWLEVGANYVNDQNPGKSFEMRGANATVRLGPRTFLLGEAAQTEREEIGRGNAARLELRHEDERWLARLYGGRAELGFDNPSSLLNRGRAEYGGKATYKLDAQTLLIGEAIASEDLRTGGLRRGAYLKVDRAINAWLRGEIGVRYAHETQAAASPLSPQLTNPVTGAPVDFTSIRARLTARVPKLPNASVFTEYEQAINDSAKRSFGVGGEYRFLERSRIYARHQFLSSLSTSDYSLNTVQRNNTTLVGIDTPYMSNGQMFSEYRVHDVLDVRSAQAAVGLRNTWELAPGLRFSTTSERVQTLRAADPIAGPAAERSFRAMTGAVEYTRNERWKGSLRLEHRTGTLQESWLGTAAAAVKLNDDFSLLARTVYAYTANKTTPGERVIARTLAGVAYRDSATNRLSGLARVEQRYERDTTNAATPIDRDVSVFSSHANWQPRRGTILTGRYAAKWAVEDSGGISSSAFTQLVQTRLTQDITSRWDAGVQASVIGDGMFASRRYGLGAEVGYLLGENMWLSAGYNVFGFKDRDLGTDAGTDRGVFVRLRYKFDEDLFRFLRAGAPSEKFQTQTPIGETR